MGGTLGGLNADFGASISVDQSGNIYSTGHVMNKVDFDPGSDSLFLNSNAGSYDFFVHKLICNDTSSATYITVDTCMAASLMVSRMPNQEIIFSVLLTFRAATVIFT